jgi:tetratricopeptide (TPR) repeat protein/O-antigen ligase
MQKQLREFNLDLAKFIRFGVYLTAFVPLIIFNDFISPFHFGKVVVFRSLIEILGAAYLILVLKDRSYLPRLDKIFWAFLFFTLAFTLTTATSVLPYPSFWGSLERMGGLWTFWHYFLFYIILTSVLTKKEHWQNLLNITVFVGVLSAFYGFGQKTDIEFFVGSGGRARIFGTIGNAALFAGTQLLVAFLSLTLFFRSQNTKNLKLFYLFAFAITSIATLMTAVRGSLLAYAVGITVFAFLWGIYKKSRFGRLAFNYLIGLAILFIVFSLLFGNTKFIESSKYLSRITDLSLRSQTTETRFWAWQAGLKGLVEGPKTVLLGWGPENFNIPFSKHFNPKFFVGPGSEKLFVRAHNMFIEVLVTMGLVGLLAYLSIFAVAFAYLRGWLRNSELAVYGIGFIPAVIAYIIHNSFIFDTSANFVIFFTILGFMSYSNTHTEERTSNIRPITKNIALISITAVVLAIFISMLIYKTNILPAKANYATTRAIVRGWEGDANGSIEKYKEALSYDVPGKYEYRHRFAQFLVGPGGPSVKEENVRRAYEFAITEIDKNIEENAIDYLPYLYASRLNILLGKDDPKSPYNDKALSYSLKALELSPTFVRTYYEIAQAYLNKKDYPNAIKYFQKAAELNPDVGVSYAYLGAAKIENGDLSGAEDLERALNSKNAYTPREVDFQRLINAYLKTNNFDRIAWIYEQLIQINPNEPQYYASLATAYANLGRIDEAVAMARKAVQVDPSFKADAEVFLKSLGRKL